MARLLFQAGRKLSQHKMVIAFGSATIIGGSLWWIDSTNEDRFHRQMVSPNYPVLPIINIHIFR